MAKTDRAILFGPMRLPFLILPPACVALGAATAVWSGSEINLLFLFFAFVGAVCAHISVNALNEYEDFKSGLDFNTRRTPFSGGSGTLPKRPEKAHVALVTGLVSPVSASTANAFLVALLINSVLSPMVTGTGEA